MRHIHNALIATAVVGLAALTAPAADAQYAPRSYGYFNGPYDSNGQNYTQSYIYVQPYDGRYYSYGADRANPSFSPRGYDQDNPRDQQLQGHN